MLKYLKQFGAIVLLQVIVQRLLAAKSIIPRLGYTDVRIPKHFWAIVFFAGDSSEIAIRVN